MYLLCNILSCVTSESSFRDGPNLKGCVQANGQVHSKREENAGDWSLMLIGLRNAVTLYPGYGMYSLLQSSLYIQATEYAVFSGSSRKLSHDRALKNWLNFYRHVRWLENFLSNPYKRSFICCQLLTPVFSFFRLQTLSKLVKLLV